MRRNRLPLAFAAIGFALVLGSLYGSITLSRRITGPGIGQGGHGGDGNAGLGSQLGGGLRVLHVHHGGSDHIVQYHASSSDVSVVQAIAGAVALTPGTFSLQIEQVHTQWTLRA